MKVFDGALNYLQLIEDYSSCMITRKYRGLETARLTLPLSDLDYLDKYNWLVFGDYKVFEILHREIIKENNSRILVIAYGGAKTLSKRITIPPAGYAYDTHTGSLDAVVKHYIDNNIISPTDTSRQRSIISSATAKAGTSYSDQSRYKNLLEEVERLLILDDIGYRFNLVDGKIQFDTYTGTDRTSTNTANTKAVFSLDLDNLKSTSYLDSDADCKNLVYVGGQGEGETRTIATVGSTSGANRYEGFTDARDISDSAELTARGLSDLVLPTNSFVAGVNPASNLTYGVDYDLGDIVTIKDNNLGISLDARITEVTEYYQTGITNGLDIVFGNAVPTIFNILKSQNKKISTIATI